MAGTSAPISEVDFCFFTLTLAIGSECGLVRHFLSECFLRFTILFLLCSLYCLVQICIYNLKGCQDGSNFHFVTETKNEGKL